MKWTPRCRIGHPIRIPSPIKRPIDQLILYMFRTTHEYTPFVNTVSHSPVGYRIREWDDPLLPPAYRSSCEEYSCNIVIPELTVYTFQLLIMASPATAIVASINPFPNDVRITFQSYIQNPNYINRERIPYQKWNRIHVHLDTLDLKPDSLMDSRLKYRAHAEFQLVNNNRLFRLPDSKFPTLRCTVPESEVFDTIANEHLQLLHAGQIKTWAAVQQKYYGINRQEARFVLKRCKNCALNRPATTKAPLVPIISGRAWERVQIDLIDMRHEPSG
jgi:hypothetical protein